MDKGKKRPRHNERESEGEKERDRQTENVSLKTANKSTRRSPSQSQVPHHVNFLKRMGEHITKVDYENIDINAVQTVIEK